MGFEKNVMKKKTENKKGDKVQLVQVLKWEWVESSRPVQGFG